MRVLEAIENALEYIESVNGHKGGSIYEDLDEVRRLLVAAQELADDYISNYREDGSPVRCSSCGGTQFEKEVKATAGDSIPAEILYRCSVCKAEVAYWAYGSFDPAYRIPRRP